VHAFQLWWSGSGCVRWRSPGFMGGWLSEPEGSRVSPERS
jgi:hypothetical protein